MLGGPTDHKQHHRPDREREREIEEREGGEGEAWWPADDGGREREEGQHMVGEGEARREDKVALVVGEEGVRAGVMNQLRWIKNFGSTSFIINGFRIGPVARISQGRLPRRVLVPATTWASGTTRLVGHGARWRGAQDNRGLVLG
jgi:hypothetical protein